MGKTRSRFKVQVVSNDHDFRRSSNATSSNRNRCFVCGQGFRTHSQADVICDLCWADNEMRPYYGFSRRAHRASVH